MLCGILFKTQVEHWASESYSNQPRHCRGGASSFKENKSPINLQQSKQIYFSKEFVMCLSLLYLNITKGLTIFQRVLYNRRKTEGTDPSLLA